MRIHRNIYTGLVAAILTCLPSSGDELLRSLNIRYSGLLNSYVAIINTSPGDVIIESSPYLARNSWTEQGRLASIGQSFEASLQYPPTSPTRFYRAILKPAAEGFYLDSDIALLPHDSLSFNLLGSAFGLGFPEEDATPISIGQAADSTRNTRIYAAALATVVRVFQIIRDAYPLNDQPEAALILDAIELDLGDGNLDGRRLQAPIKLGPDFEELPNFSNQDLIETWNLVKSFMDGLENVALVERADEEEVSLAFTVPMIWANTDPDGSVSSESVWDQADWQ